MHDPSRSHLTRMPPRHWPHCQVCPVSGNSLSSPRSLELKGPTPQHRAPPLAEDTYSKVAGRYPLWVGAGDGGRGLAPTAACHS